MDEKSLPMFLTLKQLQTYVIDWSRDTIKDRVRDDGFPMIKDEKGILSFPRDKVIEWFKRREVQAG